MDYSHNKSVFSQDADSATLIAALFFLMTRYSHRRDKSLVQPILDHFDWLSSRPDLLNTPLKNTCLRLRKSWELMHEVTEVSTLRSLH